ncbi:tetratricopeptide repeat protein [bacterium]|nr:tetratricopeptide repeat protein [bacterium]
MRAGPYEIVSEIGRGGMGIVFRARSPEGRDVAIKVMKSGVPRGTLTRFDRERRLQEQLGEADGFVPLLDSGEGELGPYIVMPFLEGGSLRERLFAGPLALDQTVALARSLARALAAAHARGIVHRDLKPENVLFSDSRPLVADLGLAKHFDPEAQGADASVQLSKTGTSLGTLGYSAPEQLADSKHVGPATDVFALGAILYECLVGRPAFGGDAAARVVARIVDGDWEPISRLRPDLPRGFVSVVERCLASERAARYHDGSEVVRALDEALGPAPGTGTEQDTTKLQLPVLQVASATPRLRSAALLPLGAAALSGLAVLGALWRSAVRERESALAEVRAMRAELTDLRAREAARAKAEARAREEARTKADAHASERPQRPGAAEARREARALLDEAASHYDRHDAGKAVELASKAIELAQTFALAWRIRGAARVDAGEVDAGLVDLARAIDLDPLDPLTWKLRGTTRDARGDARGAIWDLTKAIELDAQNGDTFSRRGIALLHAADETGALRDVERAIELDPRIPAAWAARGVLKGRKGDLDGFLADETKAIELDPSCYDAWVNRGAGHLRKGEHGDAIADATRAIEINPNSSVAWTNRGQARRAKGDLEGALADESRAIELDPKNPECWLHRGLARGDKGDLDGATADIDRSIELAPGNPHAWYDRAYCRQKKGDIAGAITDLTRALELDPREQLAWMNRGSLRLKLGEHDAALADFEKALEVSPDGPYARDRALPRARAGGARCRTARP